MPGRALGVGVEEKGACGRRPFSAVLQEDGARMVWPGGRHAESGRKRASVGRREKRDSVGGAWSLLRGGRQRQ